MIVIVQLSYFILLALFIALQIVSYRRYGWKGLLAATVGELVLILGGGTLFFIWWTWGWGPFDPETQFSEHVERQWEGIGFAVMWQVIPSLLVLCAAVIICVRDLARAAEKPKA